jgi:beta-lactamase superfamily II metal-dependent hydrolase
MQLASNVRRVIALGLAVGASLFCQTVGEPLPAWTPGALDIHHISTGRGNSTLFVLPDGTTLLVDAGANRGSSVRYVPPRPDASHTPGDWIVRYIRHTLAKQPGPRLDYAILTHFHGDHMGQVTAEAAPSKSGAYRLSGITEVGEHIPIRKMLDRGWPDYRYPGPLENADVKNYRAFLAWQVANTGLSTERFQPGRCDQMVLVHSPKDYPNFQIRNVVANGEVWTGVGNETRQHFPALDAVPAQDRPSENMCSAGFRLSYGKFDYYTGGDIPGIPDEGFPQWQDVETPVAQAVGPVEVAVLNHHGYIDSQNVFFVGTLRPRAWILFVWESAHPTARVYSRLRSMRVYPGPRDIFATNMHEANKQVVVGLDKLASQHGHVVVRVAPEGNTYRIIILDDSAESFRVTAVHGPYDSR